MNPVSTLAVQLGRVLVGHLTRYPGDRTYFVVADSYVDLGPQRPVLSLSMARLDDEAITRALLLDSSHKSASVKAPLFLPICCPKVRWIWACRVKMAGIQTGIFMPFTGSIRSEYAKGVDRTHTEDFALVLNQWSRKC